MSLKLRENYKVEFDRIDFNGKISINGLCSYMQMIAANHASLLGFNYYKNSDTPEYYWILSRVKYVIETYPRWEDEVKVETYPGGYDKLFAVRLFDFYNQEDQKIGYIIGDYILMDAVKKRPARIKGATGTLAFLDFPYEGECLEKLRIPSKEELNDLQVIKVERRKAFYSEMDLNEHMNNAHYIRWIVDVLPIEWLKTHEISSLEVNYNTAITCGTEVDVLLIQNESKEYMIYGSSIDGNTNYFASRLKLRCMD